MRVVHRVARHFTAKQRDLLAALGVRLNVGAVPPWGGEPLADFDLAAGELPEVHALLQQWGVPLGVCWTEFTKNEIDAAAWCSLFPTWEHGYPQPDHLNFGHRDATYDLSDYCDLCGIGLRQKAPFQLVGEPKWGRRAIMQLHWVGDEYFVTPEVWGHVFKPRGISCREVANTKGLILKTVVQLAIDEAAAKVSTAGLVPETCAACGRTKYQHPMRGMFPALITAPGAPITKTKTWFGSGAAADKRVLVSRDLVRAMTEVQLRGTSFWPVGTDYEAT